MLSNLGTNLEVHYEDTEIQNSSIQKVINERGKTVYTTEIGKGAIVADGGKIKLLGNVKVFN